MINGHPVRRKDSLNPCFSGGWSRRAMTVAVALYALLVLILVLVEDGLGVLQTKRIFHVFHVLILVLVEDGLGESKKYSYKNSGKSLNPCFSGGWSRRIIKIKSPQRYDIVLILVLVEDGLGGRSMMS